MNTFNNQNLGNNNVVTTTISHELKTPLNAIIGFTDLILEEESINKIKDYADIIKNNSSLLLDKIHRVIDFNSLDNDKTIFLEEVNITDLLKQAISIVSSELSKKNRIFNITCDSINSKLPSFIFTDKTKLEKCFYHLLLSTIYLNKNGEIFINFGINHEDESIQVIFSEEPISPQLSHISKSIPECNNSIISRGFEDGIGINLAICNKLSKMLGGQIGLELDNNIKSISFELPFKKNFNTSLPNNAIVLVVEDDTENFKLINKLIAKQSLTIVRCSISCFLSNVLDYLTGIGVVIISGNDPEVINSETILKSLNNNKDIYFLINMTNYQSNNELSNNTDNVSWFKQPTIRVQLEQIIDNHFKNKNKANPFINTNYDRTKA